MSRASWLNGSTLETATGAAAPATAPLESENFVTSSAVITPSGPVPRTSARSTPNSFASRLAFGEICSARPATTILAAAPVCTPAAACCAAPLVARAASAAGPALAGGFSPGATSHAIVSPTGITAPTSAVIPASVPSPGASTSTTALSVSISSSGSPLRTLSPSFFRHASNFPVSCAISSAGITTLIAIRQSPRDQTDNKNQSSVRRRHSFRFRAGFHHFFHAPAGRLIVLACCRQRPIHREVVRSRHHQLFCRESRNHFVPRRGHYNFFFNARRAPPVARRPECFERKHHSRHDLVRMLQRNQPADDRLLPDRQSDAVSELKRERRLFVRKPKLLRLRPHGSDFRRRSSRPYKLNRRIQIFPAALVRIAHRVRRVANREAPVVARAISHVGMQNVVVNRIARPQHAVGKHMRMGAAPLSRNGVHGLHKFRAHVVQHFAHQPHGPVFAHSWLHRAVQLVVRGVHHHCRVIQQRNLVLRFDHARIAHQLLAVDDFDPFLLQRKKNWRLYYVNTERLFAQPSLFQFHFDFPRHIFRAAHLR